MKYRKSFSFDGRRYYVRGRTHDEAVAKAAVRKAELEAGKRELSGNTQVKDWSKEWLETYKEASVNSRHYADIEGFISGHLNPAIGFMKLRQVRPVHLQKILNGMSGYSRSSISKAYDILRQIFSKAYANGLTTDDPSRAIYKPTSKPQVKRRAITPRERELTLKAAETSRGGLFVLIMLYCGLRPGEVAALRWVNIDMGKRVIHVTKALKADDTIGPPKSAAGFRDVPIPAAFVPRLIAERRDPYNLVCTNSKGGPLRKGSIHDLWKDFKRQMNIIAGCRVKKNKLVPPYPVAEDLTLYCYRHTYCTDLQAAGVPINVAKELMGHSNISVTAEIYTHKSIDAFNAAASLIDAYVTPHVPDNHEGVEKTANST